MKRDIPQISGVVVFGLILAGWMMAPAQVRVDDEPHPTVTDIEGNVYPIVKIGEQWWMAENLRTTRFADGSPIPTGFDEEEWELLTEGAYAVYPHTGGESEDDVEGIGSDEEMLRAYGALYNWYAVNDPRGLCPEGWHVPGDEEWMVLEDFIGLDFRELKLLGWRGRAEGGKLKSTRLYPEPHPRWDIPNEGANDEHGWAALPGGARSYAFRLIGAGGYWWTSSECYWPEFNVVEDTKFARYRSLHYLDPTIFRGPHEYHVRKWAGFSVRCIKD